MSMLMSLTCMWRGIPASDPNGQGVAIVVLGTYRFGNGCFQDAEGDPEGSAKRSIVVI